MNETEENKIISEKPKKEVVKNRYIYSINGDNIEFFRLNYNQWLLWIKNSDKEGIKSLLNKKKISKFESIVNMLSDFSFKILINDINSGTIDLMENRKNNDLTFIRDCAKRIANTYNFEKYKEDFPNEVNMMSPREVVWFSSDTFYSIFDFLDLTFEVIESRKI